MGLHGKLVAAIEFKAGGDVFHEFLSYNPHLISTQHPVNNVLGFDLVEGEYGKEGSVICWRYTHDGREKTAKQRILTIDDEKRMFKVKMVEGDLMEEFKDLIISMHIETKNENVDLVTWTLDYEALNEHVEHPISLLAYFIQVTKDIEALHSAPFQTFQDPGVNKIISPTC